MTGRTVAIDLCPVTGLRLADARQVAVEAERAGFGEPFDHPADRMREYVAALRAIWACWNDGAELDFRGEFYRDTLMTPAFHPGPGQDGPPRVHLAAVGPLMCRVAAETADGLIAHPLSSPRLLREVLRPRVASPAADHFEVSGPVMVITGADDESAGAARTAVRRQIAFYASTPAYRDVLGLYGLGDLAEFAVEAPPQAVAAEIRRRYDGVRDRALIYQPYPSPPGLWRELGSGPFHAGEPARLWEAKSLLGHMPGWLNPSGPCRESGDEGGPPLTRQRD